MTTAIAADGAGSSLTAVRQRSAYNEAERQFSVLLQTHVQELLEARRNFVPLLRRYPGNTDRIAVMSTPPVLDRAQLRLPCVERLLSDVLAFISADSAGGPISQEVTPDGGAVETQVFSTKFPHIIIEWTDRFEPGAADPAEMSWSLRRVQNQREQTKVNRLLDAANLGFELARLVV